MGLTYTTLASDTMHRANVNPLNNPPWSTTDGIAPLQIVNNEACCTAGESIGVYTGIAWPNNQWSQCQADACKFVTQVGFDFASIIVVGRRLNAINAYAFEMDGPLGAACNYSFFKLVAGATTTFSAGTLAIHAGDVIRLECFGTTISALVNGAVISSVTDTTFTSGNMAVDLFETSSSPAITDAQFSNFSGGSITGGSSASSWVTTNLNNSMRGLRK